MSEKIVQLNEEVIKGQLKELVRGSVEETLNELLEISTIVAQHPQFAYGSFCSSEKLRNGRQRIELQPGNYPDKKPAPMCGRCSSDTGP